MKIKNLNQRLGVLILLPVGLFLFLTGIFGFVYMRGSLFEERQNASILKLQRAAHQIDMKLGEVNDWTRMFYRTADSRGGPLIQQWILQQLRGLKGVVSAELRWKDHDGSESMPMHMNPGQRGMGGTPMMRFHRGKIVEVTPPQYNAQIGQEIVNIISQLKDESGAEVGTLEVSIRFHHLMEGIKSLPWWQIDQACMIDESGTYLTHTEAFMKERRRLGETHNPLELDLLKAMKEQPYGTVLGPGWPPDEVAGFCRLKYAPWAIILFVSGDEVLAPIIRFRNVYFAGGIIAIVSILLLIRSVVGKMVRSVTEISRAAERVAGGDYGRPLSVSGRDEIAQLTQSFNTMIKGLKERDFVTNTFGRYVDREIAEKLMKRPEASRLGGEKREVAILMSDIRDFTRLTETMSPDKIISFLNLYFSRLIDVVRKHEGIIVDFFGDGVLVFFDPLESPVEPMVRKSVLCALEIQNVMKNFNLEMKREGFPEVKTGIGVNAGEVIVGNIGSDTRAKYGIVGSPVNMTQRIQSTARGGEVVVSEPVYRRISNEVNIRVSRSLTVVLKGLAGETRLYVLENTESETKETPGSV